MPIKERFIITPSNFVGRIFLLSRNFSEVFFFQTIFLLSVEGDIILFEDKRLIQTN